MTQALTVYRRSQLQDADCLYRWKAVWLDGVDDSSDYSIRGQAFAAIKHRYILKLVEKGVAQDFEEATAAFIEGIAEHQTPNRLIPELRELWVRHAEGFSLDLERYVSSEDRDVAVGMGMSWSPDLIYAHPTELEIIDDKSFWAMWTEAEVRASFQARAYTRAAMSRWPGFRTYRFTMNFVRFNKVTSVVFTPAELDQIDMEVEAARARLETATLTNSWPAVAGPSCRYCELQCPLVQVTTRMPIRLTTRAEATQAASMVLVADKALKGIKKVLKAWCATNGPVNVGDVEFNNRAVTSRAYPLETVVQLLNRIGGAGALEGLTISHSALSKLFRNYPELADSLAPSCITKDTFRFGGQRPGEDDGADE